jgi:hypothetical protein
VVDVRWADEAECNATPATFTAERTA